MGGSNEAVVAKLFSCFHPSRDCIGVSIVRTNYLYRSTIGCPGLINPSGTSTIAYIFYRSCRIQIDDSRSFPSFTEPIHVHHYSDDPEVRRKSRYTEWVSFTLSRIQSVIFPTKNRPFSDKLFGNFGSKTFKANCTGLTFPWVIVKPDQQNLLFPLLLKAGESPRRRSNMT